MVPRNAWPQAVHRRASGRSGQPSMCLLTSSRHGFPSQNWLTGFPQPSHGSGCTHPGENPTQARPPSAPHGQATAVP